MKSKKSSNHHNNRNTDNDNDKYNWFNITLNTIEQTYSNQLITSITTNKNALNDNLGQQFSQLAKDSFNHNVNLNNYWINRKLYLKKDLIQNEKKLILKHQLSSSSSSSSPSPPLSSSSSSSSSSPSINQLILIKDKQQQTKQCKMKQSEKQQNLNHKQNVSINQLITHLSESNIQQNKQIITTNSIIETSFHSINSKSINQLNNNNNDNMIMNTNQINKSINQYNQYEKLIKKQSIINDNKKLMNCKTNGLGFYCILNTIGIGNFSQVKLAMHILTKERVAIKVLDKSKMNASTRRLLSQEISILESLHHPNIIRLYEVIETFSRLNLIMEYVAGGDLNRRIRKYGKLSESAGRIVFAQLIAAVNHLHERNIIHRDIKAENILFTYDFQHVQQTSMRSMATATPVTTGTTTSTSGKKDNLEKMPRNNLKMHHTSKFHNSNNQTGKMHKLLLLRNRSHSSKRTIDDCSSSSNMTTNYHNSLQRKQEHFTEIHSRSNTLVRINPKDGKKSLKRKLQKVNSMEDDQIDETFNDICLDHYRVKLVDFGFSKLTKDPNQSLTTFCGSPAYAAPELFESKSYRGGPVDMWALGIVLFFMLTGLLPYSGTTVEQVRRLVLDNHGLQPPDSLSPAAADLYRNLTARQPELRPTASQLIKYAQFARKDLTPIEIILRQRSTWTNWLTGQTFPKPLPRFKHCPPVPSTFQMKSNLLQPSSSEYNINILNNNNKKNKSIDKTSLVDIVSSLSNSIYNESINTTNNTTDNHSHNIDTSTNELNRKCLMHQTQIMKSNKVNDVVDVNDDDDADAELEATNYLLMNLGITTDEIKNSHNYATRSAVTGVYRIMLHKIHRSRRLSRLDPIVSTTSTIQENNNTKSLKFNSTLPSIQCSTNESLKSIHSSSKQPLHHEKSSSRLCYLI